MGGVHIMWICRKCGQENPDDVKVCAKCSEKNVQPPKGAQLKRKTAKASVDEDPFVARALDTAAWVILVFGLLGLFIGLFVAIPWKGAVLLTIVITSGFWALLAKGVAQVVKDAHAVRVKMEK